MSSEPADDGAAPDVALRVKAQAATVWTKLMSLLLASPETRRNGGELADA
ncbi:hypothetical protein IU510_06115 [Nocardia cyriacigeorgica]|nr:hypothetical protein [Nocardia cyriacigeorgica]MBF6097658.1 hypothetical protein [Nocardia cyriacigeorgica]MBF6161698.1 hypothetical protein [Nocardia cyriacigeorgica]MBF6200496.1 hypothetical protein [Nocardia cyriacigeorgica]MBF6342038.1 hypothetical protein [Nocardia cyriacigeorgica]MBF6512998.1 hypothetical protein [Nocardia cyriacigeorgica]